MNTGAVSMGDEEKRDVNAKRENGATPLIQAVHAGDAEKAAALIEQGADVNARGACFRDSEEATPLIWASRSGYVEVVEMLLSSGADIDEKDYYGMTALMRAVLGCHFEVIGSLLENGADVSIGSMSGETALMMARSKDGLHSAAIMELFEKVEPHD